MFIKQFLHIKILKPSESAKYWGRVPLLSASSDAWLWKMFTEMLSSSLSSSPHCRGNHNRKHRHNHYLHIVQVRLIYYESFLTRFSLSISFKIFLTLFFLRISCPLSLLINKLYNSIYIDAIIFWKSFLPVLPIRKCHRYPDFLQSTEHQSKVYSNIKFTLPK